MESLQALMMAEAECHSMLPTVVSPFVRDRLHGMLNELLETKQRITLTGGGDSSVATNGDSVLTRRPSSTSSVPDKQQRQPASAGGTPSAAALPAAFPYGLQLQENGALPPQPSKRSASPNGSATGEGSASVHSANGTPIERILTSSVLGPTRQTVPPADLQQQLQQHTLPGLSAPDILMHDPIWNPGLGMENALCMDGYGPGEKLQHAGAGQAFMDGMHPGNAQMSQYMRGAFQDGGGLSFACGNNGAAYQQNLPRFPQQNGSGLQNGGGLPQARSASPDSWLASPSNSSFCAGGSMGGFGGGHGHIGRGQRAGPLPPGKAIIMPQQQQLQQRGGQRGGYGGGGPNGGGANSYSHRMELARSNRGYGSVSGGGGAGGARIYGPGSGTAGNLAVQPGDGPLPAIAPAAGGGGYGGIGAAGYNGLGGASAAMLARTGLTPYLPPSLAAFANAPPIHPALQYGVDLQNGELDALGLPLFRPLSTYSWEQSDGLVKIYVPLRGVQTDLLRATFTPTSVEVRVVALQGKNYIYTVKALYLPINADGCHVAASKTKKNVLITMQKLCSETQEEKHWRDLSCL